jgi:hypothetical protein
MTTMTATMRRKRLRLLLLVLPFILDNNHHHHNNNSIVQGFRIAALLRGSARPRRRRLSKENPGTSSGTKLWDANNNNPNINNNNPNINNNNPNINNNNPNINNNNNPNINHNSNNNNPRLAESIAGELRRDLYGAEQRRAQLSRDIMSYTDQLGRTEHELARLDHMTVQNQSQLDAYEASVRQARDALVQLQAKSDEARRQLREMGDEIRPTATALSPYSATAFSSSSDSDEQQRLVVPTVAGLTFLAATRAFLQDRAAVRRQNDAAAVARANANINNRRTSEEYDDNGGDDNGGLDGSEAFSSKASPAKTFSAAGSPGRGDGVWSNPPGVGGGRGVGVSVRSQHRSFPLRLLLPCACNTNTHTRLRVCIKTALCGYWWIGGHFGYSRRHRVGPGSTANSSTTATTVDGNILHFGRSL